MQTLIVNLSQENKLSYPIFIGNVLHKKIEKYLKNKTVVIVTDNIVKLIYKEKYKNYFENKGYRTHLISFKNGELSKNQKVKTMIEEKMLKLNIDRDALVIALGGGVVGDMAGFVAATYMRGISYIQIPTTLLAMVDSSIGGKTAIDTPYGKNLLGVFWQPVAVFIDVEFLSSLPGSHINNGLVEAIKMFITSDARAFTYVEKNIEKIIAHDPILLKDIITRAIKIKSRVISEDMKDYGARMILNFGHTMGHAIEFVANYKLLHGYAVGLGIVIESRISMMLGLLDCATVERIENVLAKLGISKKLLRNIKLNNMLNVIKMDKKAKKNNAHFILLNKIGSVFKENSKIAHSVTDEIVTKAINDFMRV
jgi:3-dehydroquinate synthase